MEKLIIKNFGAIRDIAIDLKDLTIFIGETGTGKSILAKLIAIFRDENFWRDGESFLYYLSFYQIKEFLQDSTFIEYQSEIGIFIYNEEEGTKTNYKDVSAIKNINKETIYIPAERSTINFVLKAYSILTYKKMRELFPDRLLDFCMLYDEVSSEIDKVFVDLFKVTYQKENGKDYMVLSNGKEFLLSESASGLQTLVPTLLIFEYFAQDEQKKSYIFEEPELNLFPIAQKLLVELIAEKVLNNGHKMVITTHSPYIPTALNNLVYAYQVGRKEPFRVAELVKSELWLNPQNVASYFVKEGTVRSIIDEELQQTEIVEIDEASSLINSLYDELLEIKVSSEDSKIKLV